MQIEKYLVEMPYKIKLKTGSDSIKLRTTFLKILLLGDPGVGKTSLRKRYYGTYIGVETYGSFAGQPLPRFNGFNFLPYEEVVEQQQVNYQLWDIEHPNISKKNYTNVLLKGAIGALLIFDLTNKATFDSVRQWINDLWKYSGRGKVPVLLIGNKIDAMPIESQSVSQAEIETLIQDLNSQVSEEHFEINYLATSATTGQNIRDSIPRLLKTIILWLKTSTPEILDNNGTGE